MASDGKLIRTLSGHAHWVTSLCLSTPAGAGTVEDGADAVVLAEAAAAAARRYDAALGGASGAERLLSTSDDHTLILWEPSRSKHAVARLTGHQQVVNHVAFSPDGRLAASASFDRSVRLWNGLTGRFVATLCAHVGAVYRLAWSADSRLLVSASKDSTVKLWAAGASGAGAAARRRVRENVTGHADEVYAVDWSPDGRYVASGSKDRTVKIWRS